MKFIHTSDIHFGITPDKGKYWSAERRDAVRAAFENIVRACENERADLLIISGDLFYGRPLGYEMTAMNDMFSRIPRTKVVIIAGSCDPLYPTSPVLNFKWAGNVTYLTGPGVQTVKFDDIGTEVSGISVYAGNEMPPEIPDAFGDPGYLQIFAAYGGDDISPCIDAGEAEEKGYDYIALGGSHRPASWCGGHMAYSGSPVPIEPADTGVHGYYVGDCDKDRISLKFVPVPGSMYITLDVNVTPASTCEDVVKEARRELNRRGSRNIYQLILKGSCDPQEVFDLSALENEFRIIGIEDETEPEYDFAQLFREHPSDMIGFFVERLNTPDSSPVSKKALYYGVNALLKTADERKQV